MDGRWLCPCGEEIDGAPPDELRDRDRLVPPRAPRGFEDGYGLDGYHARVPPARASLVATVCALGLVLVVAAFSLGGGGLTGLGVFAAMASSLVAGAWGLSRTLPDLLTLFPLPIRISVDAHRLRVRRGPFVVDVPLDQVCAVRASFARKATGGTAFARASAVVIDCGDHGTRVMPLGLDAMELEYVVRCIEQARTQRGIDPALGYRGHTTAPRIRVDARPESGERAEEPEEVEDVEVEGAPSPESERRRARAMKRR